MLLAAALLLRPSPRSYRRSGAGLDPGVLRAAAGEKDAERREPRTREIPLLPAGVDEAFPVQRVGSKPGAEARRPCPVHLVRRRRLRADLRRRSVARPVARASVRSTLGRHSSAIGFGRASAAIGCRGQGAIL